MVLIIFTGHAKSTSSGIKFSLNTSYAKLLENLDLNSLIKNKELLSITLVYKNFFYSITICSLMIDKIILPNNNKVENFDRFNYRIDLFNISAFYLLL